MSKSRILKLLKILQEKTDADHSLNSERLITLLQQQDEYAERKTIYSDIRLLQEAGYQIETLKGGRGAGYYYDGTVFDASELRVLADAVLSNNFITDRKSDEMLEKILSLTNEYDRTLISDTLSYRHSKTGNEQILYNIDSLQKALKENRAITFSYFDNDIMKGKSYRRRGERYHTVPYALLWSDDRYYLIGYSLTHDGYTHYRVDRMEKIELAEEVEKKTDFDVSEYVQKVFQMFGGQTVTVKLRCLQRFANDVIDQFGDNLIITDNRKDYFEISVRVQLSPVFYSWIFKYQNGIEIISPATVREEYVKMCRETIERYEQL